MTRSDLARIRLFLFDMDGTLYLGERLFPFTPELLRTIRETGRRYLFLTNNSSKSVGDYVAKLVRLGISAEAADFLTSSQATAWYLTNTMPGARLYVCGTASLREELAAAGFQIVNDEPDAAECVVMGYDTELTYQKLLDVSRLLTERPGLPYVATNPDLVCPTEWGFVPDCGSVCGMIQTATDRVPKVVGKPEPLMIRLAMERTGIPPVQCAVVGDRIYTDVKSGLNAGIAGILVLSGETTPEILEASADKPSLVLSDAGEIIKQLT